MSKIETGSVIVGMALGIFFGWSADHALNFFLSCVFGAAAILTVGGTWLFMLSTIHGNRPPPGPLAGA